MIRVKRIVKINFLPWVQPASGKNLFFLILLLSLAAGELRGQSDAGTPRTDAPPAPAAKAVERNPVSARGAISLSYRDVLILGLVEGATEFLPISSTGHLILANRLLGLSEEIPMADNAGAPLWENPPSRENPAGNPFTVKNGVDAYIIIIQFGAIMAVAGLYWKRVLEILQGLMGRNEKGLRLARNLFLALLPAVAIGPLADDFVERRLFNYPSVAIALFAGALLIFFVEFRRKSARSGPPSPKADSSLEIQDLTARQSLFIGVFQCVAMWPGTSRSMMSMAGGYMVGLSPSRAAEFSFLLGLPTLAGAALYKGALAGPNLLLAFGWAPLLLGCLTAALSAGVAVKWLVTYLSKHGLGLFAWYRILLSLLLLLLVAGG